MAVGRLVQLLERAQYPERACTPLSDGSMRATSIWRKTCRWACQYSVLPASLTISACTNWSLVRRMAATDAGADLTGSVGIDLAWHRTARYANNAVWRYTPECVGDVVARHVQSELVSGQRSACDLQP